MIFSEDFWKIESGTVKHFSEINGAEQGESLFGINLRYKRLKPGYFQDDEE